MPRIDLFPDPARMTWKPSGVNERSLGQGGKSTWTAHREGGLGQTDVKEVPDPLLVINTRHTTLYLQNTYTV